jgi:hypothetical protein
MFYLCTVDSTDTAGVGTVRGSLAAAARAA